MAALRHLRRPLPPPPAPTPPYPAATITTVLVMVYFALLLYMACWTKLEVFFSYTPWLR